MIKCDRGNVTLQGDANTVMSEFTLLINAVRRALTEAVDEEFADKEIAKCGKLAFLDEEELLDTVARKMAGESVEDILNEKIKEK